MLYDICSGSKHGALTDAHYDALVAAGYEVQAKRGSVYFDEDDKDDWVGMSHASFVEDWPRIKIDSLEALHGAMLALKHDFVIEKPWDQVHGWRIIIYDDYLE